MTKPSFTLVLLWALLAQSGAAHAHEMPARRSIDIQVEDDALVLLVTWTAPAGDAGGAMGGLWKVRAAWERAGVRVGPALEGALVAVALAPIRVRAAGRTLGMRPLRTRIDRDGSGRRPLGVAVLVELPLDRPHILTLDVETSEPTRLRWRARADAEIASPSRHGPGRWYAAERLLTLTWSDP